MSLELDDEDPDERNPDDEHDDDDGADRDEALVAYRRGFRAWVKLGAREDLEGEFELAGYDDAAAMNERGGTRPVASDAAESFAMFWDSREAGAL